MVLLGVSSASSPLLKAPTLDTSVSDTFTAETLTSGLSIPELPAVDAPNVDRPTIDMPTMGLPTIGLSNVSLMAFRSYETYLWSGQASKIMAIVGPNGTGKTNLLEAVSLLTPGRGLRGARMDEIQSTLAPHVPWGVTATFPLPSGTLELETSRTSLTSHKRLIKVSDHPLKTHAELASHVYGLWLTPQMGTLFLDGNSARRRFLDRLVLGFIPSHGLEVGRYEKALRERQHLLKTHAPCPIPWLEGLEAILAQGGVKIVENRLKIVERLGHALAHAHGPFPKARLEVEGALESLIHTHGPSTSQEMFQMWMAQHRTPYQRSVDFALGAHKTTLQAFFNHTIPADQASTGQQKMLLMSIILAACQLHITSRPPHERCLLLLLDDVMAHLDHTHRQAFLETACALPFQTWITGTDAELVAQAPMCQQIFLT